MKRRSFLKLLGFSSAAACAPSIALSSQIDDKVSNSAYRAIEQYKIDDHSPVAYNFLASIKAKESICMGDIISVDKNGMAGKMNTMEWENVFGVAIENSKINADGLHIVKVKI